MANIEATLPEPIKRAGWHLGRRLDWYWRDLLRREETKTDEPSSRSDGYVWWGWRRRSVKTQGSRKSAGTRTRLMESNDRNEASKRKKAGVSMHISNAFVMPEKSRCSRRIIASFFLFIHPLIIIQTGHLLSQARSDCLLKLYRRVSLGLRCFGEFVRSYQSHPPTCLYPYDTSQSSLS